jgi:predicted transcriptional regulator
MTQDLLAELNAVVPTLRGAVETVRLDDTAKRALNTLRSATGQADRFSASVAVMKALGRGQEPAIREALTKASSKAKLIGKALQEASDSEGIQDAESAYDGFGSSLAELENAVRNAWRDQVQAEFEPLRGMGELLERIEATQDLGRRLINVGQEARGLLESRPSLSDLRTSVERLRPLAAALREELAHVGDDDPDVTAFLRAMVANQATARHLKPSVLVWLDQRGALDVFAVRAAN